MAQYKKVSSNIIRRQTKKQTPEESCNNMKLYSKLKIKKAQSLSRTYPPDVAPAESNMSTFIISKVN